MLNPEDRWIWDFWHVQDGDVHHLFYLQAPTSLGDPQLRHRNATIGHATSPDLSHWTEHGTVLTPGTPGAVDATATWTGSVVRGADGLWRMFYTGSTFLSPEGTSSFDGISVATSVDLHHWVKDPAVRVHADPTWYERLGDSLWPEEAWRDPWVYRGADGAWHMLITARSTTGQLDDRGVVGHATSTDLTHWTVRPPLTAPGAGFAQLEVLQRVTVHGQDLVVFSTHVLTLTDQRRRAGDNTGTWAAPVQGERIRLEDAVNLTGPSLYSGRIIDLNGTPVLLAFRLDESDGTFLGGITDPIEIGIRHGRPVLLGTVETTV